MAPRVAPGGSQQFLGKQGLKAKNPVSTPNSHFRSGSNPRKRREPPTIDTGYPDRSDTNSPTDHALHDENETNINVVVRVRGRTDQEVRDNSSLAVSTSGAMGAELAIQSDPSSMLVTKTYAFDKVFGPEADQLMLFENSVAPMLEQVLNGYNCTIFAYGQTGTGKTYTMSGDLSDSDGILSEGAGLIPRALYQLFSSLDNSNQEYAVKCSYYELYNEEIRDLLVSEELRKPARVFEDTSRRGNVVITGIEESYIKNAGDGLRLLREGSHRRQVAATKCNDLSSRSHSIFTITLHRKVSSGMADETNSLTINNNSDDLLRASKLHMVDLAGSENIGRSGAENKRARETGMINQSLLTLGRVINALVEKSHHIPYRESKLTRLLQDSLGGKTKTSMIVTVSSTNTNLEETISTLEYAARAKSIRNKPQNNQLVFRKVLIKDLVLDIERLKNDLNATRKKNGVYLAESTYKELMDRVQNKDLLCQEQARKLEVLDLNVKSSREQLQYVSKSNQEHKKEVEALQLQLVNSSTELESVKSENEKLKNELVLEIEKRKKYETNEAKITTVATDLSQYYRESKEYIASLYEKLDRTERNNKENENNFWNLKFNLLTMLRSFHGSFTDETNGYFTLLNDFNASMEELLNTHSNQLLISMTKITEHFQSLDEALQSARSSCAVPNSSLDLIVSELKDSKNSLLDALEHSLQDISMSSQKLGNGISSELIELQKDMKESYRQLVQELRSLYNLQHTHEESQKELMYGVRNDISALVKTCTTSLNDADIILSDYISDQKSKFESKQQDLIANIGKIVSNFLQEQNESLYTKADILHSHLNDTNSNIRKANEIMNNHSEEFLRNAASQAEIAGANKERIQKTVENGSQLLDSKSKAIHSNSRSMYDHCLALAESQKQGVNLEVQTLDRLLQKVKEHSEDNTKEKHQQLLDLLESLVGNNDNVIDSIKTPHTELQKITDHVLKGTTSLANHTNELLGLGDESLCNLETTIEDTSLVKLETTGDTPSKRELPATPSWTRDSSLIKETTNLNLDSDKKFVRETYTSSNQTNEPDVYDKPSNSSRTSLLRSSRSAYSKMKR